MASSWIQFGSWSARGVRRPKVEWAFLLIFFLPMPGIAASIQKITRGPVEVTKGDLITLAVELGNRDAVVEWWLGGDIICTGPVCEVDTGLYSPGEYRYQVVARSADGVEIASVSVSASAAEPLYKPKKVQGLSLGPNAETSIIANGEWIIVPINGLVSYFRKSSGKKSGTIGFAEKASPGLRYKVTPGGMALVRRVGAGEEWLLTEHAAFKFEQSEIAILAGAGIWRRTDKESSPPSSAKIFGTRVQTSHEQLLAVSSSLVKRGVLKSRIRNLEGPPVKALCSKEKEVEVSARAALEINESVECNLLPLQSDQRVAALLVEIFPWWAKDPVSSASDRWRVESKLREIASGTGTEAEKVIQEAFRNERCAEVLDLSGSLHALSSATELSRSRCQFAMGLNEEALKNFMKLDSQAVDPPFVAFLIGRTYHELGRFDLALDWYKEANSRAYEDRVGLSRYAAQAAKDSGLSRQHLKWLDEVTLAETDEKKLKAALKNAEYWRQNRPSGAVAEIGGRMDTQALPFNDKKLSAIPNKVKSSRGLVLDLLAKWWSKSPLAGDVNFTIRGDHEVRWPTGAGQAPFAISKHDASIGFVIENFRGISTGGLGSAGELPISSGWAVQPSIAIGTGYLGSSRVRDRLGWALDLSYINRLFYDLTFESEKYLDPDPNGLDFVDIDLYRYTSQGDFSHFDSVARGKIGVPIEWGVLGAELEFRRSDYRVQEFSRLDHDMIDARFWASLQPTRSTMIDIKPSYATVQYAHNGGRESKSSIGVAGLWRAAPLWMFKISANYENRNISTSPENSWVRYVYGTAVATEF